MNIDINEEFKSEEELAKFLSDGGYMVESTGEVVELYIDKFLRKDATINLELLEFAIKLACAAKPFTIAVLGYDNYVKLRNIVPTDRASRQEFSFIRGFISSLITEYQEAGIQLICLTP